MEILLAILLYLHMIVSPGTYTESHIRNLEIANQPQIEAVKADPEQMNIVNTVYIPQTTQVIVINDQLKD